MKVVVLQTYIDKGFLGQGDSPPHVTKLNHAIMEACMRSVKDWCTKNNFEYRLVKEIDLGWNYFNKRNYITSTEFYNDISLNTNENREKDLCAQRHEIALKIKADYLVIIDNDVFLKDNFRLPDVKVGLCKTPWGHFLSPDRKNYQIWERFKIFTQMYECPYPQGGVQFVRGDLIKHYNGWLTKSFKSDKWPILWDGLEQSHIFEYSRQFPEKINWLDHKYNCIPKNHTHTEINNSYLIHFCGQRKSNHLPFLEKRILNKIFGDNSENYLRKHRR